MTLPHTVGLTHRRPGPFSRRALLATASGLLALSAGVQPTGASTPRAGSTPPAASRPSLPWRGINYDLGVEWAPGYLSHPMLSPDFLQRDLTAIHDDLHANTVSFYSTEVDRLVRAAEVAAGIGLNVWLQPRLIDGSPDAKLAQLAEIAPAAEALRTTSPGLVLNLGCEETVFLQDLVPGVSYMDRIAYLTSAGVDLAVATAKLDAFLATAIATVRETYTGPISYGAGTWEDPDWSRFDIVGLNLYRDAAIAPYYDQILTGVAASPKPVVITEFGLCTFEGAAAMGGSGFTIVDWAADPPRIAGEYVRSEEEQAAELVDLIDTYAATGVTGAFVFNFHEPEYPHSPEPAFDLDMASFALVKTFAASSGRSYNATGDWEPKLAFAAVGERYAALADDEHAASARSDRT